MQTLLYILIGLATLTFCLLAKAMLRLRLLRANSQAAQLLELLAAAGVVGPAAGGAGCERCWFGNSS